MVGDAGLGGIAKQVKKVIETITKPINKAIDSAAILPPGTDRNKAFAKIDNDITLLAPAVPWLWDKTPLIESKDVQGVADNYSTVWNLGYTSLK